MAEYEVIKLFDKVKDEWVEVQASPYPTLLSREHMIKDYRSYAIMFEKLVQYCITSPALIYHFMERLKAENPDVRWF